MRLMVTGGGTGGHVYPALAVIDELLACSDWATSREDVAWVGRPNSIEERLVGQESLAFCPVSAGMLLSARPWQAVKSVWSLAKGYRESRALLRTHRPDVVLATGGYVSVPLVLAARSQRVPAMVYLPDMTPGLAVRFLSRFVQRVAVSFEEVKQSLPSNKVMVSGYPVRRALFATDKAVARRALGLAESRPMLLVFGGSRGAHSLNMAVKAVLKQLLGLAQVVHICGPEDYEALRAHSEELHAAQRADYHLYAYLHDEMPSALVAADLVVARSGAATLGEFPAAGLPAILVPYPYAGQHQDLNATYLAERGAAAVVNDEQLDERLLPSVGALLGNKERLIAMREAARGLAEPNAARNICAELQRLACG